MRAELYESAVGGPSSSTAPVEAFAGPALENDDLTGYLGAFSIGQKL